MITSNQAEIEVTEWTGSEEDAPSYHMQFSSDVRKKLNYVDDLHRGFYSGNEIVATLRRLEDDVFQLQKQQQETDKLIATNPAVKEAYNNFKIIAALAAEETR